MKRGTITILALSMFFMSVFGLQAALVVTSGVSESDFDNAFNNDRVWYGQLQPGGSGDTHPDNEFELGGDSLRYYEGNTSIVDKSDNPFEINVDTENNLSVTFNGVGTPEAYQYAVTEKFNTIWVGLKLVTGDGFNNILEVNTHEIDETALLPDMYLEEQTSNWTALKFYKDNDLDNIGDISITGNINPDMFLGVAEDEDWTYTVFATHDPAIPEPGSIALLLGGLVVVCVMLHKKRHAQPVASEQIR